MRGEARSEQIAVRVPEELLKRLDELIEHGVYESRAAAVRAGIEAIAEAARRRDVDRAIIAGYQRIPPTPSETAAAIASIREAISEEAW